jgi:mannose-1-phosphate guanylyltransferase
LSKGNLRQVYSKVPDVSVDYGLMERADNVVMVDGDFKWHDLGTWDAIYEVGKKDNNGNVLLGDKSRVCLKDMYNTLVATKGRTPLIVGTGMRNSLIIATPDVLLVLPRGKGQDVRDVYRTVSKKHPKLK